jgi:hypothetical protein
MITVMPFRATMISMLNINKVLVCNHCKINFTSTQTRSWHIPKYCSAKCFGLSIKGKPFTKEHCERISLSKSNEKHPRWKGNKAKYNTFHGWIRSHFGSAKICENKKCCIERPKRYDWSLVHGFKHSHNRKAYMQLCRSCHRRYDHYSLTLSTC